MNNRLTTGMKATLSALVNLDELGGALSEMAKGNTPRPNGVITEFFKVYWNLIKMDYLGMINKAIRTGKFPAVVTRGVISLLHKGNSRKRLTN